jgi:hypothetical protein
MILQSSRTPNDREELRHVENQASRNASLLNFFKGMVDIFELAGIVDHARLACRMQFKHFSEIKPCANNRADDVDPIENRLENWQLHVVVGRQRDKDKCPTTP